MQTYRLDAGYEHGVSPKHIVGAIANEAGLDSQYIGAIEIDEKCTYVDLPEGMPDELLGHMKKARVLGRPMNLAETDEKPAKKSFSRKPRNGGDNKRPPKRQDKRS
jgi:ATP-dependent RNA helicase DeaD